MWSGKRVGGVYVAGGFALALPALFADVVGIGHSPQFGAVQIGGVLFGVSFLVIGVRLWRLG